ncbi:DUF378 domain-containing protein [Patescibacteria group bacterium]|nr:DUF378 domain-containing protein [Patescibacteria group bacterium]
MKKFHMLAWFLLIIGGLNWLALGAFQWEIGMLFGGSEEIVSRAIYVLIGLAAVYELVMHKGNCNKCSTGGEGAPQMGGQGGNPSV